MENFIGSELEKAKKEGNKIEWTIQDLEQKLSENSRSLQNLPNEQITYTKVKAIEPNKQLLDFIDKQIEEKEKELECPVCFDIATITIFMCIESHLICSNWRPKIYLWLNYLADSDQASVATLYYVFAAKLYSMPDKGILEIFVLELMNVSLAVLQIKKGILKCENIK